MDGEFKWKRGPVTTPKVVIEIAALEALVGHMRQGRNTIQSDDVRDVYDRLVEPLIRRLVNLKHPAPPAKYEDESPDAWGIYTPHTSRRRVHDHTSHVIEDDPYSVEYFIMRYPDGCMKRVKLLGGHG